VVKFEPAEPAATLEGGSPEARALVAHELGYVDSAGIEEVALVTPPAEDVSSGVARLSDLWLRFRASVDDPAEASAVVWRSQLAAEGMADALAQAGLGHVAGLSVEVRDRARRVVDRFDNLVRPGSYQGGGSIEPIVDRIRQGAASLGASLREVRYYTQPGLAIEVTVAVPDGREFVKDNARRMYALVGEDAGYLARLVRVMDQADGSTVFVSSWDNRAQTGSSWMRGDLTSLFGQGHYPATLGN